MFLASFVAILITLLVLPGSSLSPTTAPLAAGTAVFSALAAAVVATLAEGVAPAGTDNLSVPLLTATTLYLLLAA
jgi:dolichol kinase